MLAKLSSKLGRSLSFGRSPKKKWGTRLSETEEELAALRQEVNELKVQRAKAAAAEAAAAAAAAAQQQQTMGESQINLLERMTGLDLDGGKSGSPRHS